MKRVIRRGVFETNSSSVHSLTMCTDDEWNKWEKGEVLLYKGHFDTKENIINELKKLTWYSHYNFNDMDEEEWEEFCKDNYIYTWDSYDKYVDDRWYESFDDVYVTPNGEKIHAFGYYGHD